MSSDIYTFDISFSTPNILTYDPFNFNNSLDPFSFSSSTTNNLMLPLTNGFNINSEFETASKLEQSSNRNTFDHNILMNSSNFQWHELSSQENSFFTGQIKRATSARYSQFIEENIKATTTHGSQTEEPNLLKVGRYSVEERKERISKYRAKRKQRKFNKIIKYACRKTLADNRTRIRGRFARNDETNEIPKTEEYHEQEFWVDIIDGLNDELLY